MTDASRRIAFEILRNVETKGGYSNLLLNSKLKGASDADPALVRRLVHGVLKNQTLLDEQIARYLKRPSLKTTQKILLRLGFYQLALAEGIPDHAAVSETVALAKSLAPGAEGFVNAVLRQFLRDEKALVYPAYTDGDANSLVQYLCVRYSAQSWIVRLWLDAYGLQQTEQLLSESLKEPPLTLRCNPLRASEDSIFDLDGGIAASKDYRDGRFSVQDASAQEAVRVLAPKAGERILDVCAAPGGKSCAMAEQMKDQGTVVACDIHEHKLPLMQKEAARLGLSAVQTRLRDAEAPVAEEDKDAFDAVLCDVPCSGLGVLRRKPEIKLRLREEECRGLSTIQERILQNAADAVKPGGRLLYCTCTVNPAENERVTERFLQRGTFERTAQRQIFTGEEIRGFAADGFYYCLMRKKSV